MDRPPGVGVPVRASEAARRYSGGPLGNQDQLPDVAPLLESPMRIRGLLEWIAAPQRHLELAGSCKLEQLGKARGEGLPGEKRQDGEPGERLILEYETEQLGHTEI